MPHPARCIAVLSVVLSGCAGAAPTVPSAPAPVTSLPAALCVTGASMDGSDVALAGDVRMLTVSTSTPDCRWSVDGPSWMTFEPSVGFGTGSVRIRVPASTESREAVVAVGTRSFRIAQRAAPLTISATCRTSQIGVFGGPCNAFVQRAELPTSTALKITADLAQFGAPYSDGWGLVYCGCGAWDMDLRIREPFPPGTYQVRFHVVDGEGRRATTTAPLVVTR